MLGTVRAYSDRADRFFSTRFPVIAVSFLSAACAVAWLQTDLSKLSWEAPLLFWLGLSFLVATRWSPAIALSGVVLFQGLKFANEYKISMNGMPVTALDYHVIARSPATLWRLYYWPDPVGWLVVGILGGLAAYFLFLVIRRIAKSNGRALSSAAVSVVLAAVAAVIFVDRIDAEVRPHFAQVAKKTGLGLWSGEGVTEISRQLGPVAFIVYSYGLEKQSGAVIFDPSIGSDPIGPQERAALARRYLAPSGSGARPNVIFFQLESIFNPDWAFNLDQPVRSRLFEPNASTKLLLPMRVNAIGGGSWITEFEVLTGLDTRLFGYSGYYTHIAIAPHLTGGFPRFLKDLGYRTVAYYPAEGGFYNVENALKRYGVDEFLDPARLQLPDLWHSTDLQMAEAFRKAFRPEADRPSFGFMVTNGAHSPYQCDHFKPGEKFPRRFTAIEDFDRTCQLNEYLLHLANSEKAVELVHKVLIDAERATGRPYVLVVYGDHQPHAFTQTWEYFKLDFDRARTERTRNQTFVHIMSSVPAPFHDLPGEVPTTLLSTIASAFVVRDPAEAYFLDSLDLYGRCGANSFPELRSVGMFGVTHLPNSRALSPNPEPGETVAGTPPDCRQAQLRTISAQRRSGILSSF